MSSERILNITLSIRKTILHWGVIERDKVLICKNLDLELFKHIRQ